MYTSIIILHKWEIFKKNFYESKVNKIIDLITETGLGFSSASCLLKIQAFVTHEENKKFNDVKLLCGSEFDYFITNLNVKRAEYFVT